jgi:purine-binding chemotaxis protein CheW
MRQHGQMLTDPGPAPESVGVASLVFRAGPLQCALRLDEVVETMRPLETQALAGTPPFVVGISVLRGVPTPVIEVARLLSGEAAAIERYVAVRTDRGVVALATGTILGIQAVRVEAGSGHPALLGAGEDRLVEGVATIGAEPLLLLRSMRTIPAEVWTAAATGNAATAPATVGNAQASPATAPATVGKTSISAATTPPPPGKART